MCQHELSIMQLLGDGPGEKDERSQRGGVEKQYMRMKDRC